MATTAKVNNKKAPMVSNGPDFIILGDTSALLVMTKAPAEITGSRPSINCCSGSITGVGAFWPNDSKTQAFADNLSPSIPLCGVVIILVEALLAGSSDCSMCVCVERTSKAFVIDTGCCSVGIFM